MKIESMGDVYVYDLIQVTRREFELCRDEAALKLLLEKKSELAVKSILKRVREAQKFGKCDRK